MEMTVEKLLRCFLQMTLVYAAISVLAILISVLVAKIDESKRQIVCG